MSSKSEQLRAMREAQLRATREVSAEASKEPTKHKIVEGLREAISVARGEVKPAKRPKIKLRRPPNKRQKKVKPKNGGSRFVPNKRKGRPHGGEAHLTNEARRPWEAMEISRRTWYRRLAKDTIANSKR